MKTTAIRVIEGDYINGEEIVKILSPMGKRVLFTRNDRYEFKDTETVDVERR